jgi:hypothetical protein
MSGMSSTPGQAYEADGTASSPESEIPGVTIRELSEGYDQLQAEYGAMEPGESGSTPENIAPSVPATIDPEIADLNANLDDVLDDLSDADDGASYEDGNADVAVYGDEDDGEPVETDDDGEGEELEAEPANEDLEERDPNALTIPAIDEYQPTEADQAAVDQVWAPVMEQLGLDPGQQEGLVEAYARMQAQLPAIDPQHAAEAKQALAELWGGEGQVRANLDVIIEFMNDGDRIAPELADMIMTARLPTGQRLINNPDCSGAFNALPTPIRHLGPWTGGGGGDVNSLRLAYRVQLAEQGFVVVYAPVAQLQLETADVRVQTNTECPQCQGKARVPIHGGLRDKECPRCGGRGWIKSRI